MKEYRLVAWPQLRPPFDRIAYRRMLTNMSHRHMTLTQLAQLSGMRRQDVRLFLDMLETRQLVVQREALLPGGGIGAWGPLGGWLKRALGTRAANR